MKHKTEQEQFWAGKFGDDYILRNKGDQMLSNNFSLFRDIFTSTNGVNSVMEFGANIGLNLKAIKQLRNDIELSAIEINKKTVSGLSKMKNIKVYPQSILEFSPDYPRDLVFTKGVLIHINPDFLRVFTTCSIKQATDIYALSNTIIKHLSKSYIAVIKGNFSREILPGKSLTGMKI